MSELIPYKIPSTGETVQIRKSISYAMLLMDMARETPKPKAPLQEVEIAGQVSAERNYADPDYQENLATWDADLAMRASIAVVELSIHIEMTKDRKAAVKVLRETMSHLLPLQQPDKMVWLKYVAIKSDDDFRDLINAIRNGVQPTEDTVQETADSFQGDAKQT